MMVTGVPILTLLIALPIVGSLLLLALPNRDGSKDQTMRLGALAIALVTFVLSLALWASFDQSAAAPAFPRPAAGGSSRSDCASASSARSRAAS